MIKIRYCDSNELSPGLHAAAERHGHSTTVYLLPGLSTAQRHAALRRLKISAGRGYDPKLPALQLALALLADRIRTALGLAGAVFRSHPAGSTVPVMVVSAGAITFLALSAVSIRVIHPNQGPGPVVAGAPGPAASASARPSPGPSSEPIAAGLSPPGQGGSATSQPGSGIRPDHRAVRETGTGTGSKTGHKTGTRTGTGTSQSPEPGASSTGGTPPTGRPEPTPTPTSAAPATSSSAPAPARTTTAPKPAPTPSGGSSGLCVTVGPLGLCL
jgi:hypothetical protein